MCPGLHLHRSGQLRPDHELLVRILGERCRVLAAAASLSGVGVSRKPLWKQLWSDPTLCAYVLFPPSRSSFGSLFGVTQTAESLSAPLPFPPAPGQSSNWPVLRPEGSEHTSWSTGRVTWQRAAEGPGSHLFCFFKNVLISPGPGSLMVWIRVAGPMFVSCWGPGWKAVWALPSLLGWRRASEAREGWAVVPDVLSCSAVSCLPVPRSDYHRAAFFYGDTKGNVIIFTSDDVTTGLFNPRVLPRTSKWGRETWGVGGDGPVLGTPPRPILGEVVHPCAQLRTTYRA